MNWKRDCYAALSAQDMFENTGHRNRFKELLYCYGDYPFFSKGLCKCMYMSAMDEEHFCIILEMLSAMSIGKDQNTGEMRSNGDLLVEEQTDAEYYVYQLSNAFLDNAPPSIPENVDLPPEILHIMKRSIKAAEIIDSI